jgi:UDP-3-O-[3-hydroxymyristoyl] glucosamine N-acyltransferase LpxD
MLLSDFADIAGFSVLKDCQFLNAGKASSIAEGLVVPVTNPSFIPRLINEEHIVGIIRKPGITQDVPNHWGVAEAADPKASIIALHEHLYDLGYFRRNDPTVIGKNCQIHPSAQVSDTNVILGAGCRIGANAVILENVTLGDNVAIGPGSIVGCEGFDVVVEAKKTRLIKQAGKVRIGNDVTVLANCAIAHGTFSGTTILGDNVMIDNLVQIAHDVSVGRGAKIAAGVTIAGSSRIGEGVWIGPGAVISNAVNVGSGAWISLGSVVTQDVEPGIKVSGNFAIPHQKFLDFIRSVR